MIADLILKNRSYRRFDEKYEISVDILKELINLARLSPSGKNAQPLKYIISNTLDKNKLIFPSLAWAAYLKDWPGPKEGERPSAYIVMLGDKSISENFFCDHGIAVQSMLLGAVEKGLGGCIIMSIQRENLRKALNIPDHLEILLVLALGKPIERVVLDSIKNNDFKYWRDDDQVHHVPKRTIDEVLLMI
jgi:nitroreductase